MNKKEMTDRVYDTLMQNTSNPLWDNHEPFDIDEVTDAEVSAEIGVIWLALDDKTDWKITVERIT